MTIDDSGTWWVGSEAGDIEAYLRAYTDSEAAYPVDAFQLIRCACGTDRFRVERAADVVRRECAACGKVHFICREAEDWEEAIDEEQSEAYACVECQHEEVNVGIGFASYPELPKNDAVKWHYVGVRCAACGVLGCFGDGKIGWGPSSDVYRQA